jgi:DNA-binding transcriptional LysR family regulator
MQVKALEEELGVKLFDRLGKSVALTEAGAQFLPYANKILNDVEEAKSVSGKSGGLSGTIVIGADETLCTYLLPKLLRRFRESYPSIRLLFRPVSAQHLRQSVREGHVDIAFVLDEPIVSSDLHVEHMREETFVMVASPDHALASRNRIDVTDLYKEHILLTEKGCSYRTYFYQLLLKKGADSLTELEFASVEAIKQCVMAQLGLSLLPEMAVCNEINEAKLVALPWDLSEIKFYTQMLWHEEKWISPSLQAFIDLAIKI